MAGIGFELRKYLNEDSFTGTFKAYGFAGLISAGPWVLSILGVMLIGIVALSNKVGGLEVKQFTTSVTWMMGLSLVLTGLLQLVFTRFVADRLFEGKEGIINSNLFGALLLTTVASGVLGIIIALTSFEEGFAYELLMISNFVVLSNIWIGYMATVGLSLLMMVAGLNGLLLGLLMGHSLLLFLMLGIIIPEYPMRARVSMNFCSRRQIFPILILVGFFYNAGIWIDKLIFWLTPSTSEKIIGPLSTSTIYDLPIFLAYLSIIPGMAVFLLRIETDFAEAYESFFKAVRGNASLQEIETLGNEMVITVREGFFHILRVQGVTVLLLYLLGPKIIAWLDISATYIHLFYIDLVGVAAQVLMLAVLNVLFYLDKLKYALILTCTLFVSNAAFSWLSIQAGPVYYGFGFGLSMTLSTFLGFFLLSRELDNIEFNTFMQERPSQPSTQTFKIPSNEQQGAANV